MLVLLRYKTFPDTYIRKFRWLSWSMCFAQKFHLCKFKTNAFPCNPRESRSNYWYYSLIHGYLRSANYVFTTIMFTQTVDDKCRNVEFDISHVVVVCGYAVYSCATIQQMTLGARLRRIVFICVGHSRRSYVCCRWFFTHYGYKGQDRFYNTRIKQ